MNKIRKLELRDAPGLADCLRCDVHGAHSIIRTYNSPVYEMALGLFDDSGILRAVGHAKRIRQYLPRPRLDPRGFEIGYYTHEEARGRGHASELVRAMRAQLPSDAPVYARVHHDNAASQRVLLKNGFARFWSDPELLFYVRYA